MSQITVEEPKSIVEEVDKYQCDCGCGRIDDEEQFVVQEMRPLTDTTDKSLASAAHIHKECAKYDVWADYMQTREKRESLVNVFARAVMKTVIYSSPLIISISIASITIPLQITVLSGATVGTYFTSALATVVLSLLVRPLISTVIIVFEKVFGLSIFP